MGPYTVSQLVDSTSGTSIAILSLYVRTAGQPTEERLEDHPASAFESDGQLVYLLMRRELSDLY